MTELTAETFRPFVGKIFQAAGEDLPALTLTAVDASVAPGWEDAPRTPFSLQLRGARGRVLPEGLYDFTVDGAQHFELYITPVHTPAQTHQNYQIVFN